MIEGVDMKKNAFTLMEMLVVVILIGIILAIAIPAVSNITARRSNEMFSTHLTLVENAVKSYELKNRGAFVAGPCYEIDYETLKKNGLEEADYKCEGSIIIQKAENGNSFTNESYLTCVGRSGEEKTTGNLDAMPKNCIKFGS